MPSSQIIMYDRKSKGGKVFSGRLQNISDPKKPTDLSLIDSMKFIVYFTNPSGKIIERDGSLPLHDVSPINDLDITFTTTPDDPVIDIPGYWEYTVGVVFENNITIISPYPIGFWVV